MTWDKDVAGIPPVSGSDPGAVAAEVRARLAAIVQSSDDAIVSKDLNGIIQSWNRGAERLFGWTAAEAIGQPITLIIPAERLGEEHDVIGRIRRGEATDHYETVRQRKDGSLVNISLSVSPIVDQHGKVIGASKIARDITDRKRTEDALKDADRRKDEFLATLAHELRNPLAPLMTSLEFLRLSGGKPPPADVLEMMERQIRHLVRLVDDLLEVSRITRGTIELKRESLHLNTVAQEAIEISKPFIEARGHRLELSLAPERLLVSGDRTRLVQSLANLLNNAAKFTAPQGLIRLTLGRQDHWGVLSVADTGIGLRPEDLGRVFDMFTQLHPALEGAAGGLGIGLSLVRRLVELHGGNVEARSGGQGQGAEFVVRLPLLPEARTGQRATHVAAQAPAVPPRRVLVVDDNRDAANSLALLLRTLGHEVHMAHNGREALTKAHDLVPDLVLLDIGMPEMDGYQVARQLRQEPWGRDLTVVAVTGWGQEADRERTAASGFDHHLVKPIGYAALEKLLAERGAKVH